ncbi:MAG: sensor histidine kinase [Candidatus Levyibacteriota bacterium]
MTRAQDELPGRRADTVRWHFVRALRSEPWWLRGVTWRLFGMIAAIMLAASSFTIVDALLPEHTGWRGSWQIALLIVAMHATTSLLILLIGAFLINLEHPRLPRGLAVAVAVVAGLVLGIGAFKYFQAMTDDRYFGGWDSGGRVLDALMTMRQFALPWGVAAAAWYFVQRASMREAALRAAEVARQRLDADVLEARLQALQAQVEPHFLFNTLAHIKRLYRNDPLRARLMLDSFRAYLRSALPQIRAADATLGREADLVRAYLDVQQVRMGPRLQVRFAIPEALRGHPFPSMMLMSLAENAIKHGLNPLPEGGALRIAATRRGDEIEVAVEDTGAGIGEVMGSGVGLANIRNRLAAQFGAGARLALLPREPSGLRAVIAIPRVTAASEAGTRCDQALGEPIG